MKRLVAAFLILMCCFALCACEQEEISSDLDGYLRSYIEEHYFTEEEKDRVLFSGEYKPLNASKSGNEITVCAWVCYQKYTFDENGIEENSGGYLPCSMTVLEENGRFSPVSFLEPRDGSFYESDVKSIFPYRVRKMILEDSGRQYSEELAKLCRETAEEDYQELLENGGIDAVRFVKFDAEKAVPFEPKDISGIYHAEIHEAFGDFAITDKEMLKELEECFSQAELLRGNPNCRADYKLYLFRNDGTVGYIYPAEDSRDVFLSGDNYYKYPSTALGTIWEKAGIKEQYTEQEFDGSGNILCETKYVWYEIVSSTEYEYEDDRLIRKTDLDSDGSIVSKTEYEYGDHGLVAEERTYTFSEGSGDIPGTFIPDNSVRYAYDESGNRIKSELLSAKGKVLRTFEYEFDENGRCIKITYNKASYETNEYNEFGDLIKTSSFTQYGSRTRWTEYTYNENRLPEKRSFYDSRGNLKSYEIFEYDSEGVLVRTSSYNGDGIFLSSW